MNSHATIPAERLFWSVIGAPGVSAGLIPAGLWPLIEDEVPVDAGQLWAVGAPVDPARIAVCAIRKADLMSLIPGAVVLTPASVPDFISSPPSAFNFLIGEHEPRTIRCARFRRHLAASAGTLLSVFLVAIGLSRRTSAWNAETFAARVAADNLIASIAPSSSWSRHDLTLELMQRRQAAPPDVAPPADAAEALAIVIARWPTQVLSKPQTISASGTSASISVTVPGDAQTFLAALKVPDGWRLDEPRLALIDKATRLSLELRKESAP